MKKKICRSGNPPLKDILPIADREIVDLMKTAHNVLIILDTWADTPKFFDPDVAEELAEELSLRLKKLVRREDISFLLDYSYK